MKDKEMKRHNIYMDEAQWQLLKKKSKKTDVTISYLIRQAIEQVYE